MQDDIVRAVVGAMLPLRETSSKTGMLEAVKDYVAGKTNRASARVTLREALQAAGYQPPAEDEDTIRDLYAEERLDLTLETAHGLANAARDFLQQNDPAVVEAFPAQELYSLESRETQRDWAARWSAAGGTLFPGESEYPQGRMIALSNDPIWEAISDFGLPFPPFALGSGMWLRTISWSEAKDFGLIAGDEDLKPSQFDLGPQAMQRLAAALRQRLSEMEDQERKRRSDPLTYGTGEDLLDLALAKLGLSLGWVNSKLGGNGLLEVFEEEAEGAEPITPERLAEARRLADTAVERGLGENPDWLAGACRGLARLYSATGDPDKELHYQKEASAWLQKAIASRVDFLIRRASSYDLIMAAEELLERSTEPTPEIRTQIFALVERATQQGIGEKYNLLPKAHRILAHLHEQCGEADKAEANRTQYLESADGPMLLKDAQDRLAALGENIERDTAAPILDLLTKAVEKLPPDRRNLQAEAYRATAEVLEAIGEKARAVEYYECALQMNPKIAVTKRLEQLKKQLAAG